MIPRAIRPSYLALVLLSSFPGPAAAGPKPAVLDTTGIHTQYLDGDFEGAIKGIQEALEKGLVRSHSDSLFAFKHLGVMLAADVKTRELGKHYMVQLLMLEPTVRIMDMYASDMIYMIFKNIKEEFESARLKMRRVEDREAASAAAAPEKADSSRSAEARPARSAFPDGDSSQTDRAAAAAPGQPSSLRKTLFWIGGGAAAAVGIGTVVFIARDGKKEQDVTRIK
jgi:hypothetical protein